jgi:small GTP-binding protein
MTSGNMVNFDYLLKYIIIGDAAVGKSNLLLRYVHGQFKPEYQLTIGVEFGAKNIEISSKTFRIQIWDTAGQENFRSITRAYYKNSVCALVVYDISSRDSFNNVMSWIEDCKNQSPKTIFIVLVGNKSDLEDKRQVTYEEGKELADKNELLFFESSAKEGTNVEDIFVNSAKEIAKKIEQGYYDLENDSCGIKKGINRNSNQQIHLGNEQPNNQNNGGCC